VLVRRVASGRGVNSGESRVKTKVVRTLEDDGGCIPNMS